jgi:hypothetical protein
VVVVVVVVVVVLTMDLHHDLAREEWPLPRRMLRHL